MPFLIVAGDKTSHGGMVIQGTASSDANGISIARVGDPCTCPIRGHGPITRIVTGDPTLIIDAQAAARHGDTTACGATLISSQATTSDDPGGGAREQVSSSARSAPSSPVAAETGKQVHDEQFRITDKSGKALAGVKYEIRYTSGNVISGVTGSDGLTQRVATAGPELLQLYTSN